MRWTVMTTYIIVIVTILVLMCVYITGILNKNLYEKEQIKMFEKASIISDTVSPYISGKNIPEIKLNTIRVLEGTGMRGIVLNPSYQVIFDTNKELDNKILKRDIIKSAFEGEQLHTVIKDANTGTRLMSVAVPVINSEDKEITSCIYLVQSLADTDKTIGYIKINMIVFSALICILIAFLSFGMSRLITAPVDEFIDAAKEISKGNFDKRVAVKGHHEFAQLAMTLNYMTTELGNLENNRKKFVSDASHELKTPLATIKLLCDSLVSVSDPDPEMTKEFLCDLSEEVDRLTRIVDRLLKLTRLDSGKNPPKLTKTDICALLNAVVRKLTPAANEKQIVLYTEYKTENPPALMLDYDKIYEAIYNICENAIKYTNDGGYVKLELDKENKNIVIRIEDNGPGIPKEEQERVFDRFYRPDDSRTRDTGGTGLGLAIAKEAVVMHGGKIELSSESDMGCVFTVYLPANIDVEKV